MQVSGCELRTIHLLATSVNKGNRRTAAANGKRWVGTCLIRQASTRADTGYRDRIRVARASIARLEGVEPLTKPVYLLGGTQALQAASSLHSEIGVWLLGAEGGRCLLVLHASPRAWGRWCSQAVWCQWAEGDSSLQAVGHLVWQLAAPL